MKNKKGRITNYVSCVTIQPYVCARSLLPTENKKQREPLGNIQKFRV